MNICLSDIPNSACFKSEKTGKIYVKLVCDKRRETDQYGNTHTVFVNQSQQDREAGLAKNYVGNGKEYTFQKSSAGAQNPFDPNGTSADQADRTSQQPATSVETPFYGSQDNNDDLPF